MGKAFVAKLAKHGARNPEALAAWIGRKKLGKTAFQKAAAKGHKGGGGKKHTPAKKPETRSVSREEIKSGKLDVSRMGIAELAFRRQMQAKQAARRKKKRR